MTNQDEFLWYREGGEVSDRQWRDVVEVLRVSGDSMDVAYSTTWAERLGISSLLDRARRESGR